MEFLFEKDGKIKEKYISGTNIIPYCADDFKRLMKDMEKDIDIEWNKTISPAICQIAYTFMQELTARPASVANKFQSPAEALDDLKRNIQMKFPQLRKQAETLEEEFTSKWRLKEENKMEGPQEKDKEIQKLGKIDKKPPKKEKGKKKSGKKQSKGIVKRKLVQVETKQADQEIIDNQDIEQLLDYLSEDYPEP